MGAAFDASLARGRVIEDWVADELRRDMWSIIRLADQPVGLGHGPRIDELNLPDLQIMKHGQTVAVEVKGKTAASMGQLSKQLEHGIDQRSWDSCLNYERRFMPTFLVIVEAGPDWSRRDAYIARITTLGPRQSLNGRQSMVYFPRSQMKQPLLQILNRHVSQKLQKPARLLREGSAS
jgi:hypothetical protein